jgi:hypothetical protein
MADAPKRPAPKPEPPKGHTLETFLADSFGLVFGLFIVSALLARVAIIVGGSNNDGIVSLLNLGGILDWFQNSAYPVIVIISLIISILFLWGIIYASRKLTDINKELHKKYSPPIQNQSAAQIIDKQKPKTNFSKEWQTVLTHASSNNVNDWKVAILDADSILDDCLIAKGYQGDTMGDRLKSINPADLKTLDSAWEAHKYRNGIAHGNDISFNQHEVRRIIALFEKVFKELGVI